MLNGVQNGFNLQLNSWSPGRGLAWSFFNSQITRPTGDQLFFCAEPACSRRLWRGRASGGDGLTNSSSRRRRSLSATDALPPHRGAPVTSENPSGKKLSKTRNLPKITRRFCYRTVVGYERGEWWFDDVLRRLKKGISSRDFRFYTVLSKAILDTSKMEQLDTFDRWSKVKALPLAKII
jgi:hypothetical protein